MHIGIDARELLDRPTGVGRYLAAILGEWARSPECAAHRFELYAPGPASRLPAKMRGLLTSQAAGRFAWRYLPGGGGTWWEQVRLPGVVNHDRLDVFFAPAYSAPLAVRTPLVLAIHDLSFVARPDWFRPREGFRRRWLVRRAAPRARRILTISQFSRREIVERLRIPAERVRVIPLGVEARRPPRQVGRREPLVLYAGSIFNRRRVPDLIEAFGEVARRHADARLVIAGENRTYPSQDLATLARLAGVADRVTIQAYVSDEELGGLYDRARVFVFLSEYEGLGLTPLEALAAGVPIIVLDTPVAREVFGETARFVRRGDIHGTAEEVLSLLGDQDAGRPLVARAAALLERYTWKESARQTLAALHEAADR